MLSVQLAKFHLQPRIIITIIIIIKIQNAVIFVTKWQVEDVDRVILQNPVKLQFESYIVHSSLMPFFDRAGEVSPGNKLL